MSPVCASHETREDITPQMQVNIPKVETIHACCLVTQYVRGFNEIKFKFSSENITKKNVIKRTKINISISNCSVL